MKRLFRLLLVLSLFLFHPAAFAQERKWDDALDRYERICAQCIDLRTRAQQGERIPSGSVTELLSQLKELRLTLQDAQGKMSLSQRLRYESIRLRYAELTPSGASEVSSQSPAHSDNGIPKDWPPQRWRLFALPGGPDLSAPAPQVASSFIGGMDLAEPNPEWLMRKLWLEQSRKPSPLHYEILALAGLPEGYGGLMVSCGRGRWRGYFKPTATLHFTHPSLTCRSDGTTASGYIWTTGKERTTRYSCTAGVTYRPLRWLNVYAGAGYGFRDVLWESDSHGWAQVEDYRLRSLAWDAGVVVRPANILYPQKTLFSSAICLMVGVSGLGLHPCSLEVGVGLSF